MSQPVLFHQPLAPDLMQDEDGWRVTLHVAADLHPQGVFLRLDPDNEEYLVPMMASGLRGGLQRYVAPLLVDRANPTTHYCFKVLLADGRRQLWLDAAGQHPRMPVRDTHFKLAPHYQPPLWVRDQVFYQIFPERFANGDDSLTPASGAYRLRDSGPVERVAWGMPPSMTFTQGQFYGGDLIGVRQRLDYLQRLGVTALYLNPVFASPTNHGYDTEDYFNVAPRLGGNAALAELCRELHERGMKILLDAVFNHVSDTHPWFNAWGTQANSDGAAQTPDSPYRHYFTFYPQGHAETWKGVGTIPVLDLAQADLKNYLWAAPDSVARHWMRAPYAIDGWRVDVIHMMGEGPGAANNLGIVAEFRQAIKEEKADAYFLGEHFFEASRWLQGPQEDGAMNYYGFAHPLRAFLAGLDVAYHPCALDGAEFDRWLSDARARIPYANQLVQFNSLDTHDTRRFLTMVGGDKGLLRLALALLFTYPGVPCLYYGTEIGLEGGDDPDNRRCMEWDETQWDQALFADCQALIRLRRTVPALRHGGYQTLFAAGDCFAFVRCAAGESVVVACNRGEQPQTLRLSLAGLDLAPGAWQRLWGGSQGHLDTDQLYLTLAGRAVALWQGPGRAPA